MSYICFTENMCDIELPVSQCQFCCRQTKQKAGYIGVLCTECRMVLDDATWMGSIARTRRKLLGLNRTQIAKRLGLSKHTIKKYEWVKCNQAYFDMLAALLQEKWGKGAGK